MKCAPSREYRTSVVHEDGKTEIHMVKGGQGIIVDVSNGIVSFETGAVRDKYLARSFNKFFEKHLMPHRIKCQGTDWWVVLPGNRSQKFFDGIKFGMSARQWIQLYKNTADNHGSRNYLIRDVLS